MSLIHNYEAMFTSILTSFNFERIITVTSLRPRWRLKAPASELFTQLFFQAQIKKKKLKHRVTGLWGGGGGGHSPVTKVQ